MSASFLLPDHHHHLMDKENLFHLPHEDPTGLTHRFSQSLSLQDPLFNFKVSDEDAWNLIHASAAAHLARMKMKMKTSINNREELFRQQHICRNRCVAAWGPPQVRNHQNRYKPGGGTVVKRECAGTGVFLPRRYCGNSPETRKRQACPPSNLPARMIQSSTTPPQIQPHIYEMLMSRRKAMISGAPQQPRRRSNIHGGVIDNPEVLLPQEWTY